MIAAAGMAASARATPACAEIVRTETELAGKNFCWSSGRDSEQYAADDFRPAIRLSPRDPAIAQWHVNLGLAELGLGRFDAASEEFRGSINFGNRYLHTLRLSRGGLRSRRQRR